MVASTCDSGMMASRRFDDGAIAGARICAVRRACLVLAFAVFACAWVIAAAVAAPQTAAAAPKGSISLSVVTQDSNGSHQLAGDTFTLVQVATAQVHDGGSG